MREPLDFQSGHGPLNPLCSTLPLQLGVDLCKVQAMQAGLLGLGCLTFNGRLGGTGHTTQGWKGTIRIKGLRCSPFLDFFPEHSGTPIAKALTLLAAFLETIEHATQDRLHLLILDALRGRRDSGESPVRYLHVNVVFS